MGNNLDNYVPVNVRVMQAREQHGNKLTIRTAVELRESVSPVEKADGSYTEAKATTALVTAAVAVENSQGVSIVIANGHSFVTDISDNKAIEKAESVAVGRALAFAGYSADSAIASAEEVEEFEQKTTATPKTSAASKFTKKAAAPVVEETTEDYDDSDSSEDETSDEEVVAQSAKPRFASKPATATPASNGAASATLAKFKKPSAAVGR